MVELSSIGVLTAFAAGTVSFLVALRTVARPRIRLLRSRHELEWYGKIRYLGGESSCAGIEELFVFGFSTVFVALGASATALGQPLLQYCYENNIIGGAIIV